MHCKQDCRWHANAICFHVDDCKLSHQSSRANDNMVDWLHQEYESIFEDGSGEMTVSRGRVHKYLGMTLDYTVCGRVSILMFDYIDEIINAFDKAEPKGGSTKSSAAPDDLFKVDKDHEKLPPEKAMSFTTWWPRHYMPPNEPDPILALQLHS